MAIGTTTALDSSDLPTPLGHSTRQLHVTRPRVLHLIHKLDIGGAERQLLTSLAAFDRDRFDHRVGVLFRRGAIFEELAATDVPTVEFNLRTRNVPAGIARLVRYLREERIDVVHAHLHLIAIYARIAARIAGTPVAVYTEHSDIARRPWMWRRIEQALEPWTSYKVTVSEIQKTRTIALEGYPSNKVEWIKNSVPVDDFAAEASIRDARRAELGIPADALVVGNISNMRYLKRFDLLIEAFEELATGRPHLWLLLVGDGADKPRLDAMKSRSPFGDRIVMTGKRLDVADLLRTMDVFAISSESEGLPINMLEAMAAHLPVVATRVGAIADVIDDERNGLLLDAGDTLRLLDSLRRLVDEPDLRTRLAEAGHRHVRENYDAPVNSRRLEEIYSMLLRDGRVERVAGQDRAHA